MSIIRDLIKLINHSLREDNIESCLDSFLHDTVQIIGADYGYTAFLSKNKKIISPSFCSGVELNEIPVIKFGEPSLTNLVIETLEPCIYPSGESSDLVFVKSGTREIIQEIIVPIIFEGSVIGVNVYGSYSSSIFNKEIIEILTLIASGVGAKVRYQQYINNSTLLTRTILRSNTVEEACNKIAETSAKLIQSDVVRVWLITEVGNGVYEYLRLSGWIGIDLKRRKAKQYDLRREKGGVTWQTIFEAESILNESEKSSGIVPLTKYYKNIRDREVGYRQIDFAVENDLYSLLSTPIVYEGEIFGAINVYSKRKYAFSKTEIALMEALSSFSGFEIYETNRMNDFRDLAQICNAGSIAIDYAHDVSHALANITGPITHLINYELPQKKSKGVEASIDQINSSIEYITDLFKTLVQLGKDKEPHFKNLNIRKIITQAIYLTERKQEKANVEVELICDDVVLVYGDRVKLYQVFMNLIQNSLLALTKIQRDKKQIIIKVTDRKPDEPYDIRISVYDNGPGIIERHQHRVLKSSFTTEADGSGFGLMLCKRNIEYFHRGKISYSTKLGEYTTFYIDLHSTQLKFSDAGPNAH